MKKISAIVLVLAILLASTVFTACSGNSTPKNEDELVSVMKELDKEAGYAEDNTDTKKEATYEELTSVDQLKKYHFNADLLTSQFTGAKNWGTAIRIKMDGEFKLINKATVTFKSVDNSYAYCRIQKSDNTLLSVYVPATFSVEGDLLNQDGSAAGKATYDTLYGMVRLGNVSSNYDIYSNGDLKWLDGKHAVEVFSPNENDLGDVFVAYMNSGLQLYNYKADQFDLVRVDL